MAHETRQEGDVLRMRETGPLTVPPGGTLEMKPGGTHIMLMDLKGGLKVEQEFPLTIVVAGRGTDEVAVRVGKPGAMGPEWPRDYQVERDQVCEIGRARGED